MEIGVYVIIILVVDMYVNSLHNVHLIRGKIHTIMKVNITTKVMVVDIVSKITHNVVINDFATTLV